MNPYGIKGPSIPGLDEWNLANAQARDEYALHPITTCAGYRLVDDEPCPCEGVALDGGLCRYCKRWGTA